jgi:hypothetical protein
LVEHSDDAPVRFSGDAVGGCGEFGDDACLIGRTFDGSGLGGVGALALEPCDDCAGLRRVLSRDEGSFKLSAGSLQVVGHSSLPVSMARTSRSNAPSGRMAAFSRAATMRGAVDTAARPAVLVSAFTSNEGFDGFADFGKPPLKNKILFIDPPSARL